MRALLTASIPLLLLVFVIAGCDTAEARKQNLRQEIPNELLYDATFTLEGSVRSLDATGLGYAIATRSDGGLPIRVLFTNYEEVRELKAGTPLKVWSIEQQPVAHAPRAVFFFAHAASS